jgi:tRNA 2-selenouridine synthase
MIHHRQNTYICPMHDRLPVPDFLLATAERPLLDVRSPGEYQQGHIPGALSFPLFSDEERAAVGTCYKKQGPEAALELGLHFVGPKMADFVRQARGLAPGRRLALHCWRGGQRSGSMAWLLRQAGMDVVTLAGGYKSYRQVVLTGTGLAQFQLRVVGGRTGVGKTKILHVLAARGAQVVDLEALAHHKGSAFGSIGEAPQPTVEQFENALYAALAKLDPARPLWVENESRSIGRVFIPEYFWQQMRTATLFNIAVPEATRIDNLLRDYTHTDKSDLVAAFQRIDRKLGGQHLKAALQALEADDFATAARIALQYYDKTYQHGLDTNPSPDIRHLDFEQGSPEAIAEALLKGEKVRR